MPTDEDGKDCPHGSIINFDHCPKELLHESVLKHYLSFYGVAVSASASREAIERWVGQVADLIARGERPTIRAPPDEVGTGETHYQNWEQLFVDEASGSLEWEGPDAVLLFVRNSMPRIDANYITQVVPPANFDT